MIHGFGNSLHAARKILPHQVVSDDRTGTDWIVDDSDVDSVIRGRHYLLPVAPQIRPRAYQDCGTALRGPEGTVTYGAPVIFEDAFWVPAACDDPSTIVARIRGSKLVQSATQPVKGRSVAESLRQLTRLSPTVLSKLCGVSRTTFYKWMDGSPPRDANFEHVAQVQSLLEYASRQLKDVELVVWVRSPVSPGGQTPLDYLREKRYDMFRGFVIRAASTKSAPSQTLRRIRTSQSRLERKHISAMTSPPAFLEDE